MNATKNTAKNTATSTAIFPWEMPQSCNMTAEEIEAAKEADQERAWIAEQKAIAACPILAAVL